jgi:hypothetical protein
MSWKTIRLELARTDRFPNGSAARAYLLRLPLDEDGLIDIAEFEARPALATVRRYWVNEADKSGYLIHKKPRWVFSYALGEADDESLFHLESHAIRLGEYITITEADGQVLPFRVARCEG